MRAPRAWLSLALTGLVCACASPQSGAVEEGATLQARGIAPRYEPAFDSLRSAVEAGEDDTARAILARLVARLEGEAALGTRGQAEEARAALDLAGGFERVLDGRLRVAALDLALVERPVAGDPQQLELLLTVASRWERDLELRCGAAVLQLTRLLVTPAGRQARVARNQVVEDLTTLELPAGQTVELALGVFPTQLTNDVLAGRSTYSLSWRTSELREGSAHYPARDLSVPVYERTDLAYFLPNAPVAPRELARYLERADVTLPPIMERTVRIAPERRDEALEALLPICRRATDEQFRRILPALQWLAPEGPGPVGRFAWRRWLELRFTP